MRIGCVLAVATNQRHRAVGPTIGVSGLAYVDNYATVAHHSLTLAVGEVSFLEVTVAAAVV